MSFGGMGSAPVPDVETSFELWLELGLEQGWLRRLPDHGDSPGALDCAAHSEGQMCCADRPDVYSVANSVEAGTP